MSYETYEELKKKKNQRQNFSFIFERIQVSSGASGEVKYTEEVSVPVGGSGKRHPLLLQWYRAHSRCPRRAGVPQPPALQLTDRHQCQAAARDSHFAHFHCICTAWNSIASDTSLLCQAPFFPTCNPTRCVARWESGGPLAHLPGHTPPRLCRQTPLVCPRIREQPDSSRGVRALQLKQGQRENSAATFSSSQR